MGGGLVLRAASESDADRLAEFNVAVHSDDPESPEIFLEHWTRDLLSGHHPGVTPGDFALVEDAGGDGRIVSCTCLISQQWSYEDVPFGLGRMELVGTDPEYRRKGLVRELFELLHARSVAKGELMQGITGIPWFYRQFGYEMALEMGGGRRYYWDRPGNLVEVAEEEYSWRTATEDDIATLDRLYEVHCSRSMIRRLKSRAEWHYHMSGASAESVYRHDYRLIEDGSDTPVGYVQYRTRQRHLAVSELAVAAGHPWRPVLAFLARALKSEADALNQSRAEPIAWVLLSLGSTHPAYDALDGQLEKLHPPYAWYIRIPDIPGFLRHIAPVLERRLAGSVMAGHTGTLRLNFYTTFMTMEFERGSLRRLGEYEPKEVADGDAMFPDLTFLQLVSGHRSLEELVDARADCYVRKPEAEVLLKALFPKRPSNPVELG